MKKTLKKVLVAVLALAMLVSCLVGCGSEDTKDDGAIISQLMADIVALDPARSYDISTMQVLGQVTENILAQQMDGSMKPHLAKSWEAVDELTYVYTMRDDVKFSNGDPMTMEDVLFSLKRHMDPEVASYLAGWWRMLNPSSRPVIGSSLLNCTSPMLLSSTYSVLPLVL